VQVRGLNELDATAQAARRKEAGAALRKAWPQLKQNPMGQALMGALKHEEFLATGESVAVEQANSHYLTALRMAKGGPRQTAMLLGQLGLLQVEVGNYRLGLAQLDAREKFPYLDNGAGVAVELARARALLHVGRLPDAVETIEEAVTMTNRSPKLAVWHVLALSRAALTNLAAGKHARALALYDELLPSLDGRNAVVARLARAASALGAGQADRALEDLKLFDAALRKPQVIALLHLPHQTPEHALRAYRLISAGLRANAHQRLEQLAPMTAALEAHQTLQLEEFAETDRDDDLRALVLAEGRLADVTAARGQAPVAVSWATKALDHADQLTARTGAPLAQEQTSTLLVFASLFTRSGLALPPALDARLKKTLGAMALTADPLWRVYERWFEVFLALDSVSVSP
jgi:tetratricopeptide (TPR) repeat protein